MGVQLKAIRDIFGCIEKFRGQQTSPPNGCLQVLMDLPPALLVGFVETEAPLQVRKPPFYKTLKRN
jgi:hypothetical protein